MLERADLNQLSEPFDAELIHPCAPSDRDITGPLCPERILSGTAFQKNDVYHYNPQEKDSYLPLAL